MPLPPVRGHAGCGGIAITIVIARVGNTVMPLVARRAEPGVPIVAGGGAGGRSFLSGVVGQGL